MPKIHGNFHQSKKNVNVQKTQSIEGKNPTCLAISHPDWFLPYIHTGRTNGTDSETMCNGYFCFIKIVLRMSKLSLSNNVRLQQLIFLVYYLSWPGLTSQQQLYRVLAVLLMLQSIGNCMVFWDCVIKSTPNHVALGFVVLFLSWTPSVICRHLSG